MVHVFQYKKVIFLLSVWVLACSVYVFWDTISPSVVRHYAHVINMASARAQQDTMISVRSTEETALTFEPGTEPRLMNSSKSFLENGSMTSSKSSPVSKPREAEKSTVSLTQSLPLSLSLSQTQATVTQTSPAQTGSKKSVTVSRKGNVTTTTIRSPLTTTASSKKVTHISTASTQRSSSPSLTAKSPSSRSSSSTTSTSTTTTPPDPYPKLLCVRFSGRLGNELFEYASTLGLALSLNRTAVFQGSRILRNLLKDYKQSTASLLKPSQLQARCNKAKVEGESSCCKFKEQMTKLDPRYDFRITTYLQSYRYFHNHTAEIRKALTFNDHVRAQANKTVQELRKKHPSSTLVGVHIRHGDMASDRNQKLGYPVASAGYINKSLTYFSFLYPNTVFVVASDSMDWCRQNFPTAYNTTFLTGNQPAVDMLILSSLDHVITSFGSFSWWIGFLSQGKVVYMKDFIKTNTFIGSAFNPKGKDYIYPGWTPL